MEPAGNFSADYRGTGRRFARAGRLGYPRGVYRRQLCSGKKRGAAVGRTKRGKGSRIVAIADASGLRLSPHEVKLAEKALDSLFISGKPDKLIGDKAYDSDSLDAELLQKKNTELS
jgi:hypothetical protein